MADWHLAPSVLVGLIGAEIQASLSPAMHEREGAQQGLRLVYRLIDIARLGVGPEALDDLLLAAERMGFAGVNVTYPCKQAVVPLLHDLSADARALGAVNTVLFRDGRRIGHNTDCSGFAEAFRRSLHDAPRASVLQLGAGGAGAAVAHALLSEGVAQLAIIDQEHPRAVRLAADLQARFGAGRAMACTDLAATIASAEGLVNCTPVGMAKFPGTPLQVALLRPDLWVADIVYFPIETALLRAARALGCRTMDGGGMAVFQAVGAFRLFTGIEPEPGRMLRHFAEISAPG
ncbi:shikimate dehydrogenase [Roseomonas rosulenta]|uniref:shikimate dehydrogenase n=1 Tax=Roseomonas rosulenta TaxID=2748667 RepID=UPI0018E05E07|nr:shikimate dehydrogenase [Roseomonas rosulenta]